MKYKLKSTTKAIFCLLGAYMIFWMAVWLTMLY